MSAKKYVFKFLSTNKLWLRFIYALIVLNVILIILESYQQFYLEFSQFLRIFEIISVVVFTIEYLLRIWTADLLFPDKNAFTARLRFITSFYGIIDLVAILPFFLPLVLILDLRVVRILRLFRLLRIFKLGRLSTSMKTIKAVLKDTRAELSTTLFITFVLLILSSTLMYYIEHDAQPEKFENIGQALWWSVATLTTVGYGDVYPVTGIGKILSAIVALVGIGFIALPTGIVSSAFIDRVQQEKGKKKKTNKICECPNCGHLYKE
ncbi:MAG: ion transporter [Nonlabens sp.]